MNILVTGATSNVGAEVSVRLAAAGHHVRAVALPGGRRDHLDATGVPLSYVDITEESALLPLLAGIEVVVHCAGAVASRLPRSEVLRINVDGTQTCLRAARKMSVRHFIHMSSIAVYGIPYSRELYNESSPIKLCGLSYNDSKYLAELSLRAEVTDIRLSILRLVPVYGEYDRVHLPPIIEAMRKGMFVYFGDPERPYCVVSTAFIAEAVLHLLEQPGVSPPGVETFIVAEGAPPTYRAFMTAIADALAVTPPRFKLPAAILHLLGYAADAANRLGLRLPVPVNAELAANALVDAVFDGSALRRRLNLDAVDSLDRVRRIARKF